MEESYIRNYLEKVERKKVFQNLYEGTKYIKVNLTRTPFQYETLGKKRELGKLFVFNLIF
tara:strand:+ start:366 stop:545 length:180 start_codon:yes stop_codon:yes gene_type:complete